MHKLAGSTLMYRHRISQVVALASRAWLPRSTVGECWRCNIVVVVNTLFSLLDCHCPILVGNHVPYLAGHARFLRIARTCARRSYNATILRFDLHAQVVVNQLIVMHGQRIPQRHRTVCVENESLIIIALVCTIVTVGWRE
eukprot:COSAG02_NODE_18863_length_913_cov_1.436118_1_plen_141_part_00